MIMENINNFKEDAKSIVGSILKYKEKHGNDDVIKGYYQMYDTFNGIVEYLDSLESSN